MPTVNSVQSAPADAAAAPTDAAGDTAGETATEAAGTDANAALPTAVALPTAAPTPEPTPDRSQPLTYVVQSGDVLGILAEQFDVDIAELRLVNNLDGNLIQVGQELIIPALDGSTTESASGTDAVEATESPDEVESVTATPSTTQAATVSCSSAATGHCIQPGESLIGIALELGVSVDALRAANPGIDGDTIRSGEVLNIPGAETATTTTTESADAAPATTADTTTTTTTTTDTTTTTVDALPTVGPASNADCAARNPEFPFFHAADGLCYAYPIGGDSTTTEAIAGGADLDTAADTTCPPGRFLFEDGLCYVIPGTTVVPEETPTATSAGTTQDFGTPPCRDGYVVIVSTNTCWPTAENTAPTTVTPVPAAATTTDTTTTTTTTTATTGNQVACAEPNFTEDATGNCFLTQAGVDARCTLEGDVPRCP